MTVFNLVLWVISCTQLLFPASGHEDDSISTDLRYHYGCCLKKSNGLQKALPPRVDLRVDASKHEIAVKT